MKTGNEMVWLVIILGGLQFGVLYNFFVNWLEKQDAMQGATSIIVAGGVAITLALSIPIIGFTNALSVLLIFVATGIPMIVGDWIRFVKKRRHDSEFLKNELLEELQNDKT